jgi:hypothetical protein
MIIHNFGHNFSHIYRYVFSYQNNLRDTIWIHIYTSFKYLIFIMFIILGTCVKSKFSLLQKYIFPFLPLIYFCSTHCYENKTPSQKFQSLCISLW